jgi:hypothetical protein
MKGQDYKPSAMEKLVAQWPGLAGFACLALAGGYFWYVKTNPPHLLYTRPFVGLIAAGIALLGYWALANKSTSNF